MELLHKCLTCKKYIHIVCSIDNKLQGEDDCFYCSPSCAGRDTTTGTTGQDSLLETNPGTELKADDGDPTTPENNPSPSNDPERAQSLSEDLKQNIEDPADSINENPPSSSSSPSPASEPEENQRVLRSTPSPGSKNKKKAQASKATTSPGLKKKKGRKTRSTTIPSSSKKKPPVTGAQESSIPLVPDYDVLVGMTSAEKIEFFRDMRKRYKYTRPYIAHAYDLVHDFRKCDIRVVHIIKPKKSAKPKKDEKDSDDNEKKAGALKPSPKAKESESPPAVVQQKRSGKPQKDKGDAVDKDKKAGVSDSSSKPTEEDSPDPGVRKNKDKDNQRDEPKVSDPSPKLNQGESPKSGIDDDPSSTDDLIVGFPPTPNEMEYVEEDCLRYLHESGPVDIGLDFTAVDTLVLSNLTRSSFQYDDYFKLIHDYRKFYDQWLTLDMLQFYQCWVSRSIGSYPKNIFCLPLDYYQADIEHIFEDYDIGYESGIKETFVKRMWRYVHPASHHRHKVNMWKKRTG